MDPRASLKTYPRMDNYFETKHSYNFDATRSKVFEDRKEPGSLEGSRWLAFFLIGLITGTIAFMMSQIEDRIIEWKIDLMQDCLEEEGCGYFGGWLIVFSFSFVLAITASYITVYIGPGANGSGVAELMGMLNGVNYPKVIQFDTLIVKIFGVVFGVASRLCIGKEGPLAHIGAAVSQFVVHLPIKNFDYFQNDSYKRQFLAAGTSAGVSAAFGAPIGGALFAYEISKPTTFWTFSMIWRVFFCSAVSTFVLGTLQAITETGSLSNIDLSSSAVLKFGQLTDVTLRVQDIPGIIIISAICGCLGSLFIHVNTEQNLRRPKYIKQNWQRVLETAVYACATVSTFYWVTVAFHDCNSAENIDEEELHTVRFGCEEGQFSPLASLFFNTEGGTIRYFLQFQGDEQDTIKPSIINVVCFLLCWYFWTIVTYGVWVPAGLFLPGIIIGCAVGSLWGDFQKSVFDDESLSISGFAMIGAAAMLTSYCRMTYSLAVIMLETTQSINLFIPMVLSLTVSYLVGMSINNGLYDRAIRLKQIPVLRNHVPKKNKERVARDVMNMNVVTLTTVPTVVQIMEALREGHSAFPILNKNKVLCGLIPANFLIVLLREKQFVKDELLERIGRLSTSQDATKQFKIVDFNPEGSKGDFMDKGQIEVQKEVLDWRHFNTDLKSSNLSYKLVEKIADMNQGKRIDLRPYMIENPYTVHEEDKLQKVLDVFRLMHLRHLPVLDNEDSNLIGIITRVDLFRFMGL